MEVKGFTLRPSVFSDRQQMKNIWAACFGDPEESIDQFFNALYMDGCAMVAEKDARLAAMASNLRHMSLLTADGRTFPCGYLYAVATLPEFRGMGLGAALSLAAGAELVLPAESSLYSFYGKLGFQDYFFLREETVTPAAADDAGAPVLPCSPAEYAVIREAHLKGRTHLVFSEQAICYQASLGPLYKLCAGCASVEEWPNGQICVKELLVSEENREKAIQALAARYPGKALILRSPAMDKTQCRPFGQLAAVYAEMCQPAEGDIPYFGFAFD